jgi:GntR family phosphonate transport system transcriptional regulator
MYRQETEILQRTPGVACYRQISDILQHKIDTGEYKPGDQLPTESDLSRQFGVNRHTAREAIKLLKNEGTVFGLQGKGNYVAEKRIQYRVSKKVRFSSSIMEAGLTPGTRMISCGISPAVADLAAKLDLEEGAAVLTLDIVRSADSVPLMVATTCLPAERFSGLKDHLNGSFSLYALLKEHYGIEASRSESVFETVMPNDREIHHLKISPSVPLLLVRSIARDQFGRKVEYCVTRMRGDIGSMVVAFG